MILSLAIWGLGNNLDLFSVFPSPKTNRTGTVFISRLAENLLPTVPSPTSQGQPILLTLTASSTATPLIKSPRQNPNSSIRHLLQQLCDSLHAEIAVAFRDLETGREFFFNEREMMHAASTMKVPVMIEVFRQAEARPEPRFHLDDSMLVKNEFNSIVDGSSYRMDIGEDSDESIYRYIGQKMTIRQLIEQMITVSSNLATNLLMELVGAQNVMSTLRELGIKNMQVLRGVEDLKAYRQGLNNRTDALDMLLALQAIVEHRAASPTACDTMLAILKRQKFRDGIAAGLPNGTVVANKTGSITGITHDCAIVFPAPPDDQTQRKVNGTARKPFLLVVLTRGIQEHAEANRIIAEISRKIHNDWLLQR
jgi:beta-lactamase class A